MAWFGQRQRTLAFKMGNPPVYYELQTTATFSGAITVCFGYKRRSLRPARQSAPLPRQSRWRVDRCAEHRRGQRDCEQNLRQRDVTVPIHSRRAAELATVDTRRGGLLCRWPVRRQRPLSLDPQRRNAKSQRHGCLSGSRTLPTGVYASPEACC